MNKTHNDYRFTTTHEWLNPHVSPMTMGISDHAQNLLGDIVFIELPKLHSQVKAGDELGVLESVKAAADYYAPIDGTISEINTAVLENPALINQDPYGKGWICKIIPHEHATVETLFTEQHYQTHIHD